MGMCIIRTMEKGEDRKDKKKGREGGKKGREGGRRGSSDADEFWAQQCPFTLSCFLDCLCLLYLKI